MCQCFSVIKLHVFVLIWLLHNCVLPGDMIEEDEEEDGDAPSSTRSTPKNTDEGSDAQNVDVNQVSTVEIDSGC